MFRENALSNTVFIREKTWILKKLCIKTGNANISVGRVTDVRNVLTILFRTVLIC